MCIYVEQVFVNNEALNDRENVYAAFTIRKSQGYVLYRIVSYRVVNLKNVSCHRGDFVYQATCACVAELKNGFI